MGKSLSSLTFLLLLLLITFSIVAEASNRGKLRPSQCKSKCNYRCSATKHRKDFCVQVCMSCCNRCLCVPPGTYGNKQVCACYNSTKTKQGKPKCP